MKLLIAGTSGRMSRTVAEIAGQVDGVELLGHLDRRLSNRALLDRADVVVDFTAPVFTEALVAACRDAGTRMVIGTTGLAPAQLDAIRLAAEKIAVCQTANFSIGIHVLYRLAESAARLLPGSFNIEVLETHHRGKVDAPSGTALELGRVVAEARGLDAGGSAVFARHGQTGPRGTDKIGYQALRGGDAAGEHTVYFLGDGERLELIHRAADRKIFARGALLAARNIINKNNGIYSFIDLIYDQGE